ncbi:MAG: hypothetical protein R2761_05105 [Acidimicrobiales bacterium]
MTISRGAPWGDAGVEAPADLVRAHSDADLARRAAGAEAEGHRLAAEVGPGDVLRTLGLTASRAPADRLRYSMDLGWASLDGGPPLPFVAHLCAHRALWRGPFAVAMNCAWLGPWYLGPRAHPNDGLLDVTWSAGLPARQRLLARRRLPTGSHLPHPDLGVERTARWRHRFARPVPVALDGQGYGSHQEIEVWLTPDSFWLFA